VTTSTVNTSKLCLASILDKPPPLPSKLSVRVDKAEEELYCRENRAAGLYSSNPLPGIETQGLLADFSGKLLQLPSLPIRDRRCDPAIAPMYNHRRLTKQRIQTLNPKFKTKI